MTKELRDKWVAALRSGKYKQTTGALYNYGYCCLGVLCDIAFPESKDDWMHCATLSSSEKSAVGLEDDDHEHCIQMNDTYKNTFTQIADWIEENL